MSEFAAEQLLAPSQLPSDHDPLADGILMAHQIAWLEDTSPLKLAEKGRRTGITYAEALDDTITAASSREAGGDNVFYIGDTKEKGLEFINYVAHFARIVSKELSPREEYLFPDQQPDGTTRYIAAYRVKFARFSIVALSSRPASIRGLQGIVVIDEAAYHQDVAAVLDAVNALLIWGGKIRIISTHNGEDNPFNILIKDTRNGLYDYKIHHIPFSIAVRNGLFERVCLIKGERPTEAGKAEWLNRILRSYGPRAEARDEELEAIPRKSSGAYLPRALLQRAQDDTIPIIRWSVSEGFYLDDERLAKAEKWFRDELKTHLDSMDRRRRVAFGQDFGRDGDLSVMILAEEVASSRWRTALQLELRRIPFDVQKLLLFKILDAVNSRLVGASLDARGNGQSHAEAAQQKYGVERVQAIKATVEWYSVAFPEYKAALEEISFILPGGEDVIADHRLVILKNGKPGMSDGRVQGADGEYRHGDSAIAGLLTHVSTKGRIYSYGYRAAPRSETDSGHMRARDDDDDVRLPAIGRMPLGVGLRGGAF